MRLAVVLCLSILAFPEVATDPRAIRAEQLSTPSEPAARHSRAWRSRAGRISGRVVAADSGRPVHRVTVTLSSVDLRNRQVAGTDAQGRYEFRNLPPSRYTLVASKGGFVTVPLGARRPLEPARILELAEGQEIRQVDFVLPRGGVITGHVADELGEPVVDAVVQVMRYQYGAGQRRLVRAGRSERSNDLGQFRIFGLQPGVYHVSAVVRSTAGFGTDSEFETGYAPTYYPGTPNLAEAQRLTLGAGQELANINFSLIPIRAARIAGGVLDSQGRPLANGAVTLLPHHGGVLLSSTRGARVRQDGTFTISNVAPGSYVLHAQGRAGRDARPEFASTPVTVAGPDIETLTLVTSKGAIARGEVVLSGGARPAFNPSVVRIRALAADLGTSLLTGDRSSAKLKPDWTFRLVGLFGHRVIFASGLPPPWSLRAVLLNGADITDTGFESRGAEELDLRIVLTDRSTEVVGMVTNDQGRPAVGCAIVVFAADSSRWTPHTRFVRAGRCDQEGRFTMTGLPAETYLAVAVEFVQPGESSDPEFLESARRHAVQFSLAYGETETVTLRLWTTR